MLIDVVRHVRARGTHPPSTCTTAASVGTIAKALRTRRGLAVNLVNLAPALWSSLWRAQRQEQPQEPPQPPARGGAVASGPRTERMQPGAVRGGDLARRGGCARARGVDVRFVLF